MFEPAQAISFLKVEPKVANLFWHVITMEPKECPTFSTEMDEALCFLEPSRANVKFTISLNQDANHQAVSPTRLQNPKDRNNASRRIGATYVPSFSPKAPWGQSCDLVLVFGKSHCNQQFFQGNYHMAPSVLPFGKGFSQPLQVQHLHHSHIISIVAAQKAKNLPTVKLVSDLHGLSSIPNHHENTSHTWS